MYNPFRRRRWREIAVGFRDQVSGRHVRYWYDPETGSYYLATSRYAFFPIEIEPRRVPPCYRQEAPAS